VLALSDHAEDSTWRFRTFSATGALSEAQAPAEGESPAQVAAIAGHYLVLSAHDSFGPSEVLREFTSQGIPAPTFGTNGRVAISMTCGFGPGCFAVLPDGRILAAGRIGGGEIGVKRYLADGSVDDSFGVPPWFGGGGYAWAELPGGNELDTVNKLLVLHGQPLVVGAEQVPGTGYADSQTALTLFQADGGFSSNPPPPKPEEELVSPPPPSSGKAPPSSSTSKDGGMLPVLGPPDPPYRPGSSSAKAIQAALVAVLHLRRPLPTIANLLHAGGYSLSFNSPGPGVLTVQWANPSAHARGDQLKASSVIVAKGSMTFTAVGRGMVALHLTVVGRRLLRSSRLLELVTAATFRPIGGTAVTKRGTVMARGRP
jgi:hypothetical protein